MDLVKERVSDTRRALQEADNWTSLDSQVRLLSWIEGIGLLVIVS